MTDAIPLDDWLRRIDDEYLSGFVRDGGAAVKFAVTPAEARPALGDALERRCRESGYLFVALDAAKLRAHMPQDVFSGLARGIDWRGLARRRVLRLAADRRYRVDTIDASGGGDVSTPSPAPTISSRRRCSCVSGRTSRRASTSTPRWPAISGRP